MLGHLLLAASGSEGLRSVVSSAPLTRGVVDRFVAGETLEDGVLAARELVGEGLSVSLDHLGEGAKERHLADRVRDAYLALFSALDGLPIEVSVKPSALGLLLPDGFGIALDNARAVCAAAERSGCLVTLDMEDHTTVDSTLEMLGELRSGHPRVGVAVQAMLRRSEGDLRELAGSRVRLVKGAYAEPSSVAFQGRREVDRAYVRGLRILMEGDGYPMVATHDPLMISITDELARLNGRPASSYEFQMLYGVRTDEQRRLARSGASVRVYVPYGEDWYRYFMRRLAERPANLLFFLRSFV